MPSQQERLQKRIDMLKAKAEEEKRKAHPDLEEFRFGNRKLPDGTTKPIKRQGPNG